MKISVFTTSTRPFQRGDLFKEALACYEAFADEVVNVVGDEGYNPRAFDSEKTRHIKSEWPHEFDWPLIGQQFQKGYEACTGDWVLHADLDFFFHENDFSAIRKAFEVNSHAQALSFWKYQFILPDRYNLKSRLVIAVNKGMYGDRIRFDSGGDQCQPSLDGEYIRPNDVPEARIPFYNYEKLIKTEEQIKEDVERMDRAYHRHYGDWLYSTNGKDAYKGWLRMAVGRFNKPLQQIKLNEHPKYIRGTIVNLRPDQWGFSGFGRMEINNYAQSRMLS